METLRSSNILRSGLLVLGLAVGATACANYSGEGNEFTIRGEVTEVGDQSLEVDVTDIEETHGEANGWFEDGVSHRIHDNCDCHGFWTGRKQYGTVYDFEGEEIDISEVEVGQCVELEGKIRSDKEGKRFKNRPVFDSAQVVPCG